MAAGAGFVAEIFGIKLIVYQLASGGDHPATSSIIIILTAATLLIPCL